MALSEDDQKALEYQLSQKRREDFQRFLQSKLRAAPAKFEQLVKNWAPLRRS